MKIQYFLGLFFLVSIMPLRGLSKPTLAELYKTYGEVHKKADLTKTKFPKGLTLLQRKELLNFTSRHPVAALEKIPHYDPTPKQEIGYCFGRAMAAHLLARRLGLAETQIKKLFVIGEMAEWRFHVTTLVEGREGTWYAIDPIMSRGVPYLIEDWVQEVRDQFVVMGGKASFYIMPASIVIPDVRVVPDVEKETGDRLIEIKFDPTKHVGDGIVPASPVFGRDVYRIDKLKDAQAFLMGVSEPKPEDNFNFLGMKINETQYDFGFTDDDRWYFADLLKDLSRPDQNDKFIPLKLPEGRSAENAKNLELVKERNKLGSPKLFRSR